MTSSAEISGRPGTHPNIPRFLDLLAWCEGTSSSPLTVDRGYDVEVSGVDGPHIFSDYSRHPFVGCSPRLVLASSPIHAALYSTASGRYQLLLRYWQPYCDILHIGDFSPASQDLIALRQIGEHRGAVDAITAGDVEAAATLCKATWASLPGAGYADQRSRSMADVVAKWEELGQ